MSEHALQVAVAHMLQLVLDPQKTWWSSLDHAAKLSARYGAERKRRGVKRGLPDFILMWRSNDCEELVGIELKFGKGARSPAQIEVRDAWLHIGYSIYVARSLAEVQEILDHCRIPCLRRMTLFLEPDHERPARAARPRHPRARRQRKKPKGEVPLVLAK